MTSRSTSSFSFLKKPHILIPIVIVSVLLIILISVLAAVYLPNEKNPARVHSITGDVTVDTGNGFGKAEKDATLRENAIIKTGPQSGAVIILYEKAIVTLKENTQVTIQTLTRDNQALTQQTGTVWTKIAKLGGREDFSIQTPTTTATVRGTMFRTSDGQLYELVVGEGTVEAGGTLVYRLEKLVGENGTYRKTNLTPEDKLELVQELENEISVLRELRLREILKNDVAMSFIRTTYGATDDQIAQFLLDIDNGTQSEDVVRENAPTITPSVEMVFAYDAEIRNTLALIDELRK